MPLPEVRQILSTFQRICTQPGLISHRKKTGIRLHIGCKSQLQGKRRSHPRDVHYKTTEKPLFRAAAAISSYWVTTVAVISMPEKDSQPVPCPFCLLIHHYTVPPLLPACAHTSFFPSISYSSLLNRIVYCFPPPIRSPQVS